MAYQQICGHRITRCLNEICCKSSFEALDCSIYSKNNRLAKNNRIVTSTLVRAKETAQIINNELEMELTVDPDLREGHVEKENDKELLRAVEA